MERKISAEEATILACERPKLQIGANLIDSFYDCPTCAYWLAETVSVCDEKSCEKCNSSFRNAKQSTVYANVEQKVSNGSDYRTGRDNCDIVKCGENMKISNESFSNLQRMPRYRDEIECPFTMWGCNFRSTDWNQMNAHNEDNIHRHMNMMMLQIKQQTPKDTKSINFVMKSENENSSHNGSDESQPEEMKKLHDRVVMLEQELCDYKLDIKRLSMVINKISISSLRDRSGTLVWQIDDFEKKVQSMQTNPMSMFYSPDFYTDPNGYRFCGRISVSAKSKMKDTLGFHVHMMQSENDYHLDWPFRGCIQIFLIHEDSKLTLRDKIMTNEKSTAFQRPNSEISAISFGFTEYASINTIVNDGFLSSDGKLTIKLHIGIV